MTYIQPKAPIYFPSGTLIDPNDVNENFLYLKKSLNEISARRYEHVPLVIPFNSGTNGTMNKEMRSRRLPMFTTMLLERAYLYFNGTGSVQILLTQVDKPLGTDGAVAGITNPILAVSGSDPTVQQFDIFTTQLLLQSGSTYRFELSGTAANMWGAVKADLVLHLRADRAHTGSSYSFLDPSLTLFTEHDTVSAASFLANSGAVSTAVQTNISNAQTALKPMFYQWQNNGVALDISVRQASIPCGTRNNVRQTVGAMSFFSVCTASAQADYGNTLQTSFGNVTCLVRQNQTGSYGEANFKNFDLTVASSGSSTDRTKDQVMTLVTTSSLNSPLFYGYVWIK